MRSALETLRSRLPQAGRVLLLASSLLAMAAALVPLYPRFPSSTALDDSWHLGLHQAMAQRLRFGTDVVFTSGPYFGIYTGESDPATDALTLGAAAYLALAFGLALYSLGRSMPVLLVALLLVYSIVLNTKDALLLSYPLVVCLVVFKRFGPQSEELKPTDRLGPGEAILFALFVSALGLLPLVKGTLLIVSAISSLLCAGFLVHCKRGRLAAAFVALPAVACVFFWSLAGQSIDSLPGFVSNLAQLIAGYGDAMSLEGTASGVLAYVAAASVLTIVILLQRDHSWTARTYLLAAFFPYLFLGFKAGFVRHDGHEVVGVGALASAALLLMSVATRLRAVALFPGLGPWLLVLAQNGNATLHQAKEGYVRLAQGALLRAQGGSPIDELHALNLRHLSAECPLPKVDGTADIYSHRQGCLIASGNAWSPRPTLQSYAAYTPALARLNAEHLRGDRAPAYVFFRVEPIDGRLPSLEDGHSWLALINGYELEKLDGDLALLRRRNTRAEDAAPATGEFSLHTLGQEVVVPRAGALLAEIDVRKTFLGGLFSTALKSPQLAIEVTLASGARRRYRFVPGMAVAPILFSPLVNTTRDFALLSVGHPTFLADNAVVSFRITTSSLGARLWSDQIGVRFTPVALKPGSKLPLRGLFDRPAEEPPASGRVSKSLGCDGGVDRLNGLMPVPMDLRIGGALSIEGWAAASAKDGVPAEEVYIVLAPAVGAPLYVQARRTPRPDVGNFFKQPSLDQSGFVAQIDTSSLRGDYRLYVAQLRQGRLIQCQPFRKLVIAP